MFTLFPARDFEAPLHGEIQHRIRQETRYTAISYVWGDPTPCATIYNDKWQLGIGKNLSDVLRNIRSISEDLDLWIDAICINQSDTVEKSAQVQEMANIYKDADQVYGWVGELTQDAEEGFQLFRELTGRTEDEDYYGKALDAYIQDASNDHCWVALVNLLDGPYWTRLWILQEAVINQRVFLRFGRNPRDSIKVQELLELDFIRFEVVSKWQKYRRNDWERSFIQRFDSLMNNVYSSGYLSELYPLKVGELQPFLLSSLCGGPLCSNPLDYVFGFIGLFEYPPVTVDYGSSPRKLFLDVLEGAQHRTQKLDFLSWAWGNHSTSASSPNRNEFNLPAWAVDWSWRTRFVNPIPLANSKESQRILWDTFYAASGGAKSSVKIDRESDVLTLKGCEVSKIDAIGSLAEVSSSTLWPEDWSSIAMLGTLKSPPKDPALRSEKPELNVWHTNNSSEGHTKLTPEQLNIWWRVLFGDTLSRERRIDPPVAAQQAIPPRSPDELEDLCNHMTEYLQIRVHEGRRMFRTTDGGLGLAPSRAKPGDIVCVLLGGDVLYVLRSSSERETSEYQFVGECYLHSMMDGQALGGSSVELKEMRIEANAPTALD